MIHLYKNPDEMPIGLLHIKNEKGNIKWDNLEMVAIPHNMKDQETIKELFLKYGECYYSRCYEDVIYPFGVYVLYQK